MIDVKVRLLIGLTLLMSLPFFSGCGEDDENQTGLFSEGFDMSGNALPKYKGFAPDDTVGCMERLVGYGWMSLWTREISKDGSLKSNDYYEDLIGVSPHYFYCEKDSLTKFFYCDACCGASVYRKSFCDFSEWGILSIREENGDWILYKVEDLAFRSSEMREIYGVSAYRRMDDAELTKVREEYSTNVEDVDSY